MKKIEAKIFDKSKYAFYVIKKPFTIKTSKGVFDVEKNEVMGIRRATSDKSKIRLIDENNPNKVVSIPLENLFELKKLMTYKKDSKQGDIFDEI